MKCECPKGKEAFTEIHSPITPVGGSACVGRGGNALSTVWLVGGTAYLQPQCCGMWLHIQKKVFKKHLGHYLTILVKFFTINLDNSNKLRLEGTH